MKSFKHSPHQTWLPALSALAADTQPYCSTHPLAAAVLHTKAGKLGNITQADHLWIGNFVLLAPGLQHNAYSVWTHAVQQRLTESNSLHIRKHTRRNADLLLTRYLLAGNIHQACCSPGTRPAGGHTALLCLFFASSLSALHDQPSHLRPTPCKPNTFTVFCLLAFGAAELQPAHQEQLQLASYSSMPAVWLGVDYCPHLSLRLCASSSSSVPPSSSSVVSSKASSPLSGVSAAVLRRVLLAVALLHGLPRFLESTGLAAGL